MGVGAVIEATFVALPMWPHDVTRGRRHRPFSSSWPATLDLLGREIAYLRGRDVLIAAGFRHGDIRQDGWPRANALQPSHPGIELSFESRHGRLVYATDSCTDWQDNVRSLALGLESLRAVDRFGISRRGEQYAGWRALPSGGGLATAESAWDILNDAVGVVAPDETLSLEETYRRAAMSTHPDRPEGSAERFVQVKAAFDFLRAQGVNA